VFGLIQDSKTRVKRHSGIFGWFSGNTLDSKFVFCRWLGNSLHEKGKVMAGTGKKWLIGCGVGCGVIILLNILLFVGAGIFFTRPMNKAVTSQKSLTESFGTPNEYTPEAGSLTPARMEIFLTVRAQLIPSCEEFEKATVGFQAMDELGEDGDEPSLGEVFKGLGQVMGSIKGLVMEMGEVMEIRNEALLAQGMGMGEYTWIYVLSYNSWLGYTPNVGVDSDGGDFSHREKDLIADLMESHAESLAKSGRLEEAQVWLRELKKLGWDDGGVPFADNSLPEEIRTVLEPFRERLEASYCEPMSEFDLGQIKKKGLSFHSN